MFEYAFAVILGYMFLGAGLKYIDQVYDVHIYTRQYSFSLAILCGLVMGSLIAIDQPSSVILTAIILGVLLTGKIDNKDFVTVTLLSFLIPALYIPLFNPDFEFKSLTIFSAVFLVVLGMLDEFMDKIGDQKKIKILTTRPLMKFGVLILAIAGVFNYVYLLAFLGFDTAYMYVGIHSASLVKRMTALEIRGKDIIVDEL